MIGTIRMLNELEAVACYSKWALCGAMGLTYREFRSRYG